MWAVSLPQPSRLWIAFENATRRGRGWRGAPPGPLDLGLSAEEGFRSLLRGPAWASLGPLGVAGFRGDEAIGLEKDPRRSLQLLFCPRAKVVPPLAYSFHTQEVEETLEKSATGDWC